MNATEHNLKLPFGLPVPATASVAWGARLIVDQDGRVDLVSDRQGCAGEDSELFLFNLGRQLELPVMLDKIRGLLRSGEMDTRGAQDFVLHHSDTIEVHANTKASAGYCYVAAWWTS